MLLAVIPARAGSKGIPGKNTAPVAGKPLISWTIEAALGSNCIDAIEVSTDDEAVVEVVETLGLRVNQMRPSHLATDSASIMDVVLDCLSYHPDCSQVLLLQPTSPLRTSRHIDDFVRIWRSSELPAAVSVTAAASHPAWTYTLSDSGHLGSSYYTNRTPNRQDLPEAWVINGALYAASIDWLREHRTFICPETLAYRMPPEASVDIDQAFDLTVAEFLLMREADG